MRMELPLSRTPICPEQVASWVAQARGGSQLAFACLHRRFLPLVHGILLGRYRPALADELSQECFATAFGRLPQLKETAKFGPWIAAMARRIQPPSGWQEAAGELSPQLQCSAAAPDEQAEAQQLLRTISALPRAYRETLLLRLVEGLSGPEIAVLTALTPDSVRVNLHRGMDKLRRALDLQRDGRLQSVRP